MFSRAVAPKRGLRCSGRYTVNFKGREVGRIKGLEYDGRCVQKNMTTLLLHLRYRPHHYRDTKFIAQSSDDHDIEVWWYFLSRTSAMIIALKPRWFFVLQILCDHDGKSSVIFLTLIAEGCGDDRTKSAMQKTLHHRSHELWEWQLRYHCSFKC